MELSGNTILITGGTSGIGRALGEAFYRLGNCVIVTGRRQALLDEITAAHPGMYGFSLDLQNAEAIDVFAAQIQRDFPALNVLINNAGISLPEDLTADAIDVSVTRALLQTDVMSVLQLTQALLPALRSQPASVLMATSSALAFVPLAAFPTYCASKAFLHSWLESVRFQLRNTSVEVLELVPPYVQTELTGAEQAKDPYAMPLDEFIAEVMQLLGDPRPPLGEILVNSSHELRFASQQGKYEQLFSAMNNQ